MRRIVCVLVVALLAGCSTTSVTITSGSTGAPPRGGLQVQAHASGRAAAALILAGLLLSYADWVAPGRQPPLLEPGRHISEQDCTRPIDPAAGNLRCK